MKCLIYCPKGRVGLYDNRKKITGSLENFFLDKLGYDKPPLLNDKIVAEFECNNIEKIFACVYNQIIDTKYLPDEELIKNSCIDYFDLVNYLNPKFNKIQEHVGYAIHIKNLHIYDRPRDLSDYYTFDSKQHINIDYCKPITKAPQNMMYCWELWQDHSVIDNRYFYENILISIHPEHLCKILNGEKTIIVVKKILKCMKELIK